MNAVASIDAQISDGAYAAVDDILKSEAAMMFDRPGMYRAIASKVICESREAVNAMSHHEIFERARQAADAEARRINHWRWDRHRHLGALSLLRAAAKFIQQEEAQCLSH